MSTQTVMPSQRAESPRTSMTTDGLRQDFEQQLYYALAEDRYTASDRDRYYALALAIRDRLIERWIATQQTHHKNKVKRIYYLSLEFLMGRLLETMSSICGWRMCAAGLYLNWD